MKPFATRLPAFLFACTTLGALSLSPAHAGSTINKCIDRAGQVTLTDQPCDANTVSSTVAVPGTAPDNPPVPTIVSTNAPVRPVRWTPAPPSGASAHAALSGDMATLKQARVRMLLQDGPPRTRLALLDR